MIHIRLGKLVLLVRFTSGALQCVSEQSNDILDKFLALTSTCLDGSVTSKHCIELHTITNAPREREMYLFCHT